MSDFEIGSDALGAFLALTAVLNNNQGLAKTGDVIIFDPPKGLGRHISNAVRLVENLDVEMVDILAGIVGLGQQLAAILLIDEIEEAYKNAEKTLCVVPFGLPLTVLDQGRCWAPPVPTFDPDNADQKKALSRLLSERGVLVGDSSGFQLPISAGFLSWRGTTINGEPASEVLKNRLAEARAKC